MAYSPWGTTKGYSDWGWGNGYGSTGTSAFGKNGTGVFGSAFDNSYAGPNGSVMKTQGWLGPVAGIANGLWSNYNQGKAIDAQKEDADRRWGLMLNDSKKNWAMRMNEWRQNKNNISHINADNESVLNGGGYLRGGDAEKFSQGNTQLDWNGNAQADPFSVDGSGNVITPPPAPARTSAFVQNNPANRVASKATTTPQQVAGMSNVKKKMPGDKARANEQDRVKKLTV